jgi:hypothetical protein
MNTNETISLKDLRRRLFEILDTMPEGRTPVEESCKQKIDPLSQLIQHQGGKHPSVNTSAQKATVVKAIPVAFPVVEVNYKLRERVPEPIGLINRAVLQAVCEFGPCNAQYIDDLLGLGSDVIERTLANLTKSIPDLVQKENEYTAGPTCSELLKSGGFARLVTHERKFLVNGLTDKLLPVDFWRTHKGLRLLPDSCNPNGPMCTESGTPTPVAAKIADRGVTGREHLQQLAGNGEAGIRQSMGLPAGVCERLEEPMSTRIAWVLSFLLVWDDASVEVLSARRNATVLVGRNSTSKEYMRHVCQGMESWVLNDGGPTQPSEKWRDRWPDGTQIEQGASRGLVLVKIADLTQLLRFETDEGVKEKNGRHLLEQGRDWNPPTFNIYRIIPGDFATARATALLRGIRELRFVLRPLEITSNTRSTINLKLWWQKWTEQFEAQIGMEFPESSINFEQLLSVADRVNDTEFQDKLEWLYG